MKINTLIHDLNRYANLLHDTIAGKLSAPVQNALLRELRRLIDELTGIRDASLLTQGFILRDAGDHILDTDVSPALVFDSLDDAKAVASDVLLQGEPAYDLSVIWIYCLDGTVVARLDAYGWQDDDHA